MSKTRLPKLSCDKKVDPTERKIRNLTAKEFTDWLIKYHGLPKGAADTVRMNLEEQYKYHNLNGRLHSGALTAEKMADALDEFWNASIQAVHYGNDQELAMPIISAISQGFAAVSARLRKGGEA